MVTMVYRSDFVFAMAVAIFRTMISAFLWRAIYGGGENSYMQGYSYRELVLYLLLTNATSLIFSFELCFKIGQLVKTGRLTPYLYRPINILYENLFESIGASAISMIVFSAVMLFFDVHGSGNGNLFVLKLLYFVLSYILWVLVLSLIGLLGFKMIQMWPLKPIMRGLYMLFAGILFPLEFLPWKLGGFIKYNPFGLVGSTLTQVVMGRIGRREIESMILGMLLGIVIFYFLYNWLLKKSLKLYEGAGA
ncbi:MAG: ABC-2 family transporter protein [Lachnospiraceae bacterium]|nr:ABC-2 family transporter protein [Lachnospiraceae bacterium]